MKDVVQVATVFSPHGVKTVLKQYSRFLLLNKAAVHCLHSGKLKYIWVINFPEDDMSTKIQEQIKQYISSLPEPKRSDMEALHQRIKDMVPGTKLWFEDGKDSEGKTVSNPNIGYGSYTIHSANGSSREFFQVGISGNTTGISVYILGIKDRTYLSRTFAAQLGKATVTGYCIRFKALKDINIEVLEAAIRYGLEGPHA